MSAGAGQQIRSDPIETVGDQYHIHHTFSLDDRPLTAAAAATTNPTWRLDNLFQKTKTTPCLYWLPLTQKQVNTRRSSSVPNLSFLSDYVSTQWRTITVIKVNTSFYAIT